LDEHNHLRDGYNLFPAALKTFFDECGMDNSELNAALSRVLEVFIDTREDAMQSQWSEALQSALSRYRGLVGNLPACPNSFGIMVRFIAENHDMYPEVVTGLFISSTRSTPGEIDALTLNMRRLVDNHERGSLASFVDGGPVFLHCIMLVVQELRMGERRLSHFAINIIGIVTFQPPLLARLFKAADEVDQGMTRSPITELSAYHKA